MNLVEEITDYVTDGGFAFADRFIPFYVCSALSHEFNLMNEEREVYFVQRSRADTRLHMSFVSPPGFTKSFLLETMFRDKYSVFGNSTIQSVWEMNTTEAGFVGTWKQENGQVVIQPGLAQEHGHCIIAIEEFSAITNSMMQDHSLNLDNAMLSALDKGYIYKRLAAGPIKYRTFITLCVASQPERFNLTSGLGRRFFYVYFIPNSKEQKVIEDAYYASRNIQPDMVRLGKVHKAIDDVAANIQKIDKVKFDDSIEKMLRGNVQHFEAALFEKLSIGYTLATADFDDVLEVKMDNTLKRMIIKAIGWRKQVKAGAKIGQVLVVLDEFGAIDQAVLRDKLLNYGLDYTTSMNLLKELEIKGLIRRQRRQDGGYTIVKL